MSQLPTAISVLALGVALVAGITDWRSRRIPNWLTVAGAIVGLCLNSVAYGWVGLKASLLGCLLGLLLLLPFFALNAIGAGDCKLVAAMGAFLGPGNLLQLLLVAIFVNAAVAVILIVAKGRLWKTLKNMGLLLLSLLQCHRPPKELSLADPDAVKVPFGVAFALAAIAVLGAKLGFGGWRIP